MMEAVRLALRVLSFRATREEFERIDERYLPFGLACTWVVGMGRWWDDPRANVAQHLGLGSVMYVFVLAFILWMFVQPVLRPNLSYWRVFGFVTFTAPPALLYAIPIERWTDLETARSVNVGFLGVVALWRVALFLFFAIRGLGLRWWPALIAGLLPIVLIICLLTAANLEGAVFDLMGGLRPDGTPHDEAYGVLVGLSFMSILAAPVLILLYVLAVRRVRKQRSQS